MAQEFVTDGPVRAGVRLNTGEVVVEPAATNTASAEVRALDPEHEPSVQLAASAEIRFDGHRLDVRLPEQRRRLRSGVVQVRLALPESSSLAVRAGAVDVTATGSLRALDVKTGSGTIRAGHVGDATFLAGSGRIELGRTEGKVTVKGGSVDLLVGEAATGDVLFVAGSGSAQVSVAPGTTVQLDLMSGSGDVRCELPMERTAPSGGAALRLRLKTGSGDVLVAAMATV